jgi:dipeptidyl aminopeptidase/acylaminoacyl peptidase
LFGFSDDLQVLTEIPVLLPPDCGLFDMFSPARGTVLAVELSCSFGQTVLFLDTGTGSLTSAFPESDSHFLDWSPDGGSVFLRVDSGGNPHVERINAKTLSSKVIPIDEYTYDLAVSPNGGDFTFTFSRGLGFGSELHLAQDDGRTIRQLYADALHYISYARWSPDGTQLAFIKIPDSRVPFAVGELWVMNADGSEARLLAEADAGHGYAADWSPDGGRIAFVVRENRTEARADEIANALISNIYIVDVHSDEITQVTYYEQGRAETPHWSPDGNKLSFLSVIDGRMIVQVADLLTGEIKPVLTESACCPSWTRK